MVNSWAYHVQFIFPVDCFRTDQVVIDGELFYEAHWGHQLSQEKSHGLHLALADDMRKWKTAALAEAMCHGFNIVPGLKSGDHRNLNSRTYF